MHIKMLSAICFNLDQSKILLSGNGLMIFIVTLLIPLFIRLFFQRCSRGKVDNGLETVV